MSGDGYIPPVGFAREPRAERSRWIGRIGIAILVGFLAWLAYFGLINPESREPSLRDNTQTELPAD